MCPAYHIPTPACTRVYQMKYLSWIILVVDGLVCVDSDWRYKYLKVLHFRKSRVSLRRSHCKPYYCNDAQLYVISEPGTAAVIFDISQRADNEKSNGNHTRLGTVVGAININCNNGGEGGDGLKWRFLSGEL